MRTRMRALRAVILAGSAMLGLLGAHALDYLLLFRNGAVRAGFLRQTGHVYFHRAFEFAIASAFLAAIAAISFGYLRVRNRDRDRWSIARATAVLALIQSGGFVALEAGEPVAAHARADQLVK